jgi:predicted outer membrane protein
MTDHRITRRFVIAATASLLASSSVIAQTAAMSAPVTAAQYLPMASMGGDFLEATSRLAFDKTENAAVRRFARAEITEQVNLADRLAQASGGASGARTSSAPGGVAGLVVSPIAGAGTGAASGAATGANVAGPVGAVVGAGVGAATGAVSGAVGGVAGLVSPAPMMTDAQKAATYAQLQSFPAGPEFDTLYVQAQIRGHQEAQAVHGGYAQNGDDPELRRIARNALPLIRQHLAVLRGLNSRRAG